LKNVVVDELVAFLRSASCNTSSTKKLQQVQVNAKGEARNTEMRKYYKYKISQGKTKIQS